METGEQYAAELIDALRASWPRREALCGFAADFAAEFEQAFKQLTREMPNHELKSVNAPLEEATITLANGYLAEQSQGVARRRLAELIRQGSQHGSLTEVLLTAGCALGDDACNGRLLELFQKDVARRPAGHWGAGKSMVVVDDMPSHLLRPLKRGFNRGRLRLLDFYGRTTLVSWLCFVATRLAIDWARATSEEPCGKKVNTDRGGVAMDAERDELLRVLVEVAPQVAETLINDLRRTSPQQYSAAVLRLQRGYGNKEIAQRLGNSEPAVSQLLDKVCRRFLELLSAADERLADAYPFTDFRSDLGGFWGIGLCCPPLWRISKRKMVALAVLSWKHA